ncbi:metal ABC transporter ATP-binding protein [Arhodomonas sp. AD133]|uniref:metal ABC transporter ATP-binding protein n=1 Tax=Arhodomonas sp. AD133 TaxID=3415009 RepID=UPI003EBC4A60
MTGAIELDGVTAGYDGRAAIVDVSLTVGDGEFLGLVGPNGSGKSTLLKAVLGLIDPMRGRVRVLGMPPRRASRHIGYVPQHAAFPRDFPISVRQVVRQGRLRPWQFGPGYAREDRRIADEALTEVEMGPLADRSVSQLSGGQLQRVLIARALAVRPRMLLLDEPTANIDPRAERDLFDLLKALNRRMTIVVVSHDIGFVSEYVSHVACLNRSLVCHTAEPLDEGVLERLYGHPVRVVDHAHVDHVHGGGDGVH